MKGVVIFFKILIHLIVLYKLLKDCKKIYDKSRIIVIAEEKE